MRVADCDSPIAISLLERESAEHERLVLADRLSDLGEDVVRVAVAGMDEIRAGRAVAARDPRCAAAFTPIACVVAPT